jgi:hypothetical protein
MRARPLQADIGGPDIEVGDQRRYPQPGKPRAWLQDNGIRNLAITPTRPANFCRFSSAPGHVVGLPTTLLVDAAGCEIAVMKGPAEWASADALALVRAALGRSS